jgi:DNA-binding transcriptional MerR regulator
MDRPLTPAETARRFGVTIKALRVYESHGLLTPLRERAGSTRSPWRAYGPEQLNRLHQILALKRLGLPLARIGQVLKGPDALGAVLALQANTLARDCERLGQALALVRQAQAKLAAGQALSIDDLATLTKETVMTSKPDPQELKALCEPYTAKHFTPEERARLEQYAQADAVAEWEAVIAEAKAVMAAGDPSSPAALEVARRWYNVVGRLTGGDAALRSKGRTAWLEALADPKLAAAVPLTPELMDFMARAKAHLPH